MPILALHEPQWPIGLGSYGCPGTPSIHTGFGCGFSKLGPANSFANLDGLAEPEGRGELRSCLARVACPMEPPMPATSLFRRIGPMARLAICPRGEVRACLFQTLSRVSSSRASARSPYDPFRCLPRRVHYGSGNGVPLLAALFASVVVPVG
jgi:hypothetical protein